MTKRLLFAAALFLFSIDILSSCTTDFQVNAPYKEQYAVYGLLEMHNNVQVIKISKVFQNSSSVTASQAAQQIDSLYQQEDLAINLVEWQNGTVKSTTSVSKYFDKNKQSGYFASPGQYLYATPPGFTLNSGSTYQLTIDNPKTKAHLAANTVIVGDAQIIRPNVNSLINFTNTGAYYLVEFIPGQNAATYDLNILIPIAEYRKKDSSLVRRDTLTMSILKNFPTNGNKIDQSINGKDFFAFLPAFLKADPTIFRRMDKLDFDFIGAGTDLANYIQVNTPASGIVQKKPDYTNIGGGLGIFSSRIHTHQTAPVSPDAFTLLQNLPATAPLNFRP